MRDARVVAGASGTESREVRWVAVSEGPVEDFVREGELILTSGMGCDDEGLAQLVREVMASGAAALCVGIGPARFVERIGSSALQVAERGRFPLIELPWELRFVDISRAVVDQVLADRYNALDDGSGRTRFTSAVLDGLGFQGVADRLESFVTGAVVILDADASPQAFGRRARETLGPRGVAAVEDASSALSPKQLEALSRHFSHECARPLTELSALALGPGLGLAIPGKRRPVAYLYALAVDQGASGYGEFDALTLTEAAEAVAMEALRRQAAAEAESRVRGDFLWALITGSLDSRTDIAEDAALLGYSALADYEVAVLEAEEEDDIKALRRQLVSSARTEGLEIHCGQRDTRLIVLLEGDQEGRKRLRRTLEHAQQAGQRFDAGIPRGTWRLTQLKDACAEAQGTIAVARSILGPHVIAEASTLKPFLMIGHLADEPQARSTALEIVEPLRAYDRRRSGALIETLEAYLDERGNASRTARRLYLNRHSLLHRLARIEELTQCSLDSRDDCFVLELSLRLLRFGAFDDGEGA